MGSVSGIGVLDKAVAVIEALAAEGPLDLAQLVAATGMPRATTHRLARGLEVHGLVDRDERGRFVLGLRLLELGAKAGGNHDLRRVARPLMEELAASTGESVQLFVRDGDWRVCIESVESLGGGLRDIVPVGARLALAAGSGGKVLRAWSASDRQADLDDVRKQGWAQSVAEREAGVASVSAPVFAADGRLVAALSVSGPIERTTRRPGVRYAAAVVATAAALTRRLSPG